MFRSRFYNVGFYIYINIHQLLQELRTVLSWHLNCRCANMSHWFHNLTLLSPLNPDPNWKTFIFKPHTRTIIRSEPIFKTWEPTDRHWNHFKLFFKTVQFPECTHQRIHPGHETTHLPFEVTVLKWRLHRHQISQILVWSNVTLVEKQIWRLINAGSWLSRLV